MRKVLIVSLVALLVVMPGVNVSAINVIAVKKDSASKWFYVDLKGRTYYENMLECEFLHEMCDGCFSTGEEFATFGLYGFGAKAPRKIADNLYGTGHFSEGVCVVMREYGKPIEIIDKSGKTVLVLDKLGGDSGFYVTRCMSCYGGRFVVGSYVGESESAYDLKYEKRGVVSIDGSVIQEPKYREIILCGKKGFVAQGVVDTDGDNDIYIINDKDEQWVLRAAERGEISVLDEYVVLPCEDATVLMRRDNMKVEMSLPAGCGVVDICGNLIAYRQGDSVQVITRERKRVLAVGGEGSVMLTDGGILAGGGMNDEGQFECMNLYSNKGEFVKETEWHVGCKYNGFVVVWKWNLDADGMWKDDSDRNLAYNLLNMKLKPVVEYTVGDCYVPYQYHSLDYSPVRVMYK